MLTFGSRSGDFTTVNGPSLPNGLVLNRTFGATNMTLTAAAPLLATNAADCESDQQLLQHELLAVSQVAIEIWAGMGLPQSLVDRLRSVELIISDFAGLALATSAGLSITVDRNAAGHSWFVDTSANLDEEFSPAATDVELTATLGSEADGRMDLLTVLLHEQAHLLGLDHATGDPALSLMLQSLSTGTRRKLNAAIVDEILANGDW